MKDMVVMVKDFSKQYGGVKAVDGISFTVKEGEIFALLGPNGAGKTSTLECLEGIRKQDGGTIRILDVDPAAEPGKLPQLVGVQLQQAALPATIKVEEAIKLFSAYHGIKPRFDLLERLGLQDKMQQTYQSLSTGQKRRLALALAVAHNPKLVILDEPTAGLDVQSRVTLHQVLRELRDAGTTIILSTHDMAEVESLADRVAIMLKGKIVASGTPRELTATGNGLTKVSVRATGRSLLQNGFAGVVKATVQDDYRIYYSSDPGAAVCEIIARINEAGEELEDLRVERPSLEERFLELTQEVH
ncbi:ABC transporter ATP-binding protein [Dethiobacter alkaliphilus]|uniref:ABC transporter ATP-binding protein n=1 Tax=Dethiobacter alkaliphilus TaxID=427926 RepID=UPI002226E726|nr:ABC transporter ATP-binding protein [Dethiobacter alkaliphilus]MCW3490963.1 ABC transporter ATP-binding protein [Dethiobacter alkaliphilus]